MHPNEKLIEDYELNVSGSLGLIPKNNYVYDYPDTQSEWWGNAEAVMNPSNQSVDGFFVSRSAGDYYSNQKMGLLIRFDVNGNEEWIQTTNDSVYPAAMVTALPDEKSVLGCYHYNYDYVDFFSFDKDGDTIYNWTYNPSENVKLVAMEWSDGLWAVGDIETPTKGIFIRKMNYTNGSLLASNIWNLGVDTHIVDIDSDNKGGLFITGWILNSSRHQLFIAHSNSSGDIVSSNIIYDDLLNVRGVACTYNASKIYVVGIYQNAVSQDKYNSYLWSFDSNCSLQESVLITSEANYGTDYYAKGDDTSWIYFNYDIKILNSSPSYLIVSDVIEKDVGNTMIHLLDSSLNEIDYYEYKTDSGSSRYHDTCGKLVITKFGKIFSIMKIQLMYADHPYIGMVEYSMGFIDKAIYIDGDATGIGSHNWSWAVTQYWCNGSGTNSDPYVIKDLIINGRGTGSCIYIENSDVHFKIQNCSLNYSGRTLYDGGILLKGVENGQLLNNIIYDANNGIVLDNCDLNYIIGNSVSDNQQDGIRLRNSDNNFISGNNLSNNGDKGIYLDDSDSNIISGNTVSFSYHGIDLWISRYNNITENTLNYNNVGIFLYWSGSNYLSDNIFNGNTKNIEEITFDLDFDPFPQRPSNPLAAVIGFVFFIIIALIALVLKINEKRTPRRKEYNKRSRKQKEIPYRKEYTFSKTTPQREKEGAQISESGQIKTEEIQQTPSITEIKSIKPKVISYFCEFCGVELNRDATLCSHCGLKVKQQ
jgi:parallel beta-helix repeat protein